MSVKTQLEPMGYHWIKVLLALGVLIAGFYGHYYLAQPAVVKLLGWMVLAGTSAWLLSTTPRGKQAVTFLREARVELRKVVWPTRRETGQATLMVFVVVVIASLVFWSLDSILLRLVAWLTGFRA